MIDVQGLSKGYQTTLFQEVSLRFENGLVYMLTGENGAGKSTFLRCIAGFEVPDSGSVRVEGEILYQPQQALLFPMTCFNNVFVANRGADEKEARALFSLLGIEYLMDRGVRGLSGGERQKVTLIRSLLTGGDAMLLDEPFSALDRKSALICLDLLKDYARCREVPLVFVSHDIDAGQRIADHRYHLEEGGMHLLY